VQSTQLWKDGRCDPEQKAPQAACVGISWQSSQVLEDTVLAEPLGCFNSVETQQHGIEQRQQHLADAVAVVALSEPDIGGQRILEPDSRQEAVPYVDAAVMRQRTGTKRNSKSTWAFGHTVNPTLKVAFTGRPQHPSGPPATRPK